jgi:hypothetical protein
MSDQTPAPHQDSPTKSSAAGRAKWERPVVIVATLKQAEFGPVVNPTFDGATTAAKVS